ncbi:MAG: glycosyltransferase [Victivallaceae bacterium]|nr:glycosyltransferase [Victivallaceae bacterium]
MIEVIVCSNDPAAAAALERNVRSTIGMDDFVFSVMDASSGHMDLFTAYDRGIRRSRAEWIVCCHQDILFHTQNWGPVLIGHFAEDLRLGAIGVAGGSSHPRAPGGWMSAPPVCRRLTHLIQHDGSGRVFMDCAGGEDGRGLHPVATLDGVLLAFRREVFDECSFAASGLRGFHGYDLDISLQLYRRHWRLAVTSKILIEHFSPGRCDLRYVCNVLRIHARNPDILPIFTGGKLSHAVAARYEARSLLLFLYTMRGAGAPQKLLRHVILQYLPRRIVFCRAVLLIAMLGWLGCDAARLRRLLQRARW